MAKPEWISVDPSSGSGNQAVQVTASKHTGRNNREGQLTIQTAGGKQVTVNLTQTALAAHIDAGEDQNIAATTTTSQVAFTTNCAAIKLIPSEGVTISKVTMNGSVVTDGGEGVYTPSGDPGASADYEVVVDITVPVNETVSEKSFTVEAQDSVTSTITATVTITQTAGDSTLSVDPDSLEFITAGEQKQISITSNDSWTIS